MPDVTVSAPSGSDRRVLLALLRVSACAAILAATACAGTDPAGEAAPAVLLVAPVTIELDVFSGRPNPRWQASAGAVDELNGRLAGLAPAPERIEPPSRLGYRGFVLTDGRSRVLVVPAGIRVTGPAAGTELHLEDTQGLEEWLQAEARRRGLGDVFESGGSASS